MYSLIARESNISVREITNGCLCCILVGAMGDALQEIADMHPDRIIIETSGSAYPAPIAMEIKKMDHLLRNEGIVTVVDVLNFPGYSDKSYTSKLQCKCTDLVLLNKHELVSDPHRLDSVLDDIYEVCGNVPKVKTMKGVVPCELLVSLRGRDASSYDDSTLTNITHHDNDVQVLDGMLHI